MESTESLTIPFTYGTLDAIKNGTARLGTGALLGSAGKTPALYSAVTVDDLRVLSRLPATGEIAYYVSQVNNPGTWGPELATGFKRLLKCRSLGQELFNGSLICG